MLKKKIAYTVLALVSFAFLMGATYVIHNMSTGVMHQSQDIYSVGGVSVSTELGTIEAKLSEHQVDIDSIESAIGDYATKAYVNGTDEILTTAVDSIEVALSSSGSLPTRVGSLEVGIAGVGKLGNNQTWTGNNIFSNLVDGTASVALYAPSAGNANYSLTAGTASVALNATTAAVALTAINADNANMAVTAGTANQADKITGNAYVNKIIAGANITVTPGADSREVTITGAAAPSAITKMYGDSDSVGTSGNYVTLVGGDNTTVTRTGDSLEIDVTVPASGVTKIYGNTDSTGASGAITLKAGTGITSVRTGQTVEIATTALTAAITKVFGGTDATGSTGPEITLVNGKNITMTRTGGSIEVKVNSPIEEETINVTNANLADTEYSGFTLVDTMAASCSVYDVLYKSSSGWNKAKADADSTLPAFGMCLETGTGERELLLRGCIRNNSWNWTEGNLIYVSTATAGAITATKPSTTGNRIQIVGVALDADTIYFDPNSTWIEI